MASLDRVAAMPHDGTSGKYVPVRLSTAREASPLDDANRASDSGTDQVWTLTDLIDLETLQSIQDTFAKVFGIPTVIVDPDGRNLTKITHRLAFCEDLTRTNDLAGARCLGCEQDAMSTAADTCQPSIFQCWNGLYDCAIPIAPNGRVLGYFLCGQVLTSSATEAPYRERAREIGVAEDEYVEALRDVKVIPLDAYQSSIETMHALAEMIAGQAAAAIENFQTLQDAVTARADAAGLLAVFEGLLEAFSDIGSQPDHTATLDAVRRHLRRLIPLDGVRISFFDAGSSGAGLPVSENDGSDQGVDRQILDRVLSTGAPASIVEATDGSATMIAPLSHRGSIQGVAVLNRMTGPFTDQEVRLANVIMVSASVALHATRLNTDVTTRLREEQLFTGLLRDFSQRLGLEHAMRVVARTGTGLFGAMAAYIQSPTSGHESRSVRLNLDEADAEDLVGRLGGEIETALARGQPKSGVSAESCYLIVPFGSDAGPLGYSLFLAPETVSWDLRVAEKLASHAALGLDNARMLDRDLELSRQYRELSQLSTSLLTSSSLEQVARTVVSAVPGLLRTDAAAIVALDGASSSATLISGDMTEPVIRKVPLTTNARLAAVKLSGGSGDASLFQSWIGEVLPQLSDLLDLKSVVSEPLAVKGEFLGGLVVGWRSDVASLTAEDRRLLALVAAAAAGGLSQFAAQVASGAALKRRLAELQVLTDVAERVGSAPGQDEVYEEVVTAFRDLAGLDGAVLMVRDGHGLRLAGSCGTTPSELLEAVQRTESSATGSEGLIVDADTGHVMLPLGSSVGIVAGWSSNRLDSSTRSALTTLARLAVVALDKVRLHDEQVNTIGELELANRERARQYLALQRLLRALRTIGESALSPGGMSSMVSSLSAQIGAPIAAVRADGSILARWPADFEPAFSPPQGVMADAAMEEGFQGEGAIIAFPARVERETVGWLIAALDRRPTEVDEAIMSHGGLLTALVILQETTTAEVESRLKGGFLDELLSGDFAPDRIRRQGSALGYDFDTDGQVVLVEPTATDVGESSMRELHRSVVSSLLRNGRHLVTAIRGTRIVAIVSEDESAAPGRPGFEEELMRELTESHSGLAPNVVVGTLCTRLKDYPDSYAAALKGLGLQASLGRSGSLFSFRSPGLEHVLLRANEPAVLLDFIGEYVAPLTLYDETHTSDLQQTLMTFYESDLNLQETARRLHIHVSTLRYRLQRVQDIVSVDPREGPGRLDLELALRAAAVLGESGDTG